MYFSDVTEINELKGQYRRLAARFHPDRGGCSHRMTHINLEYEEMLAALKGEQAGVYQEIPEPRGQATGQPAGQQHRQNRRERRRRNFQDVRVGQTVFVNGTECEVQEVTARAFRVVAKGRTRQTWFNKTDGYCRFNRRFRAAWVQHNRRQR